MELPNRKYQEIIISLDALLDTRLGLLASIDQSLAEKALEGNYHERFYDEFGDISVEEFRGLYANRDKDVLKYSTLTYIIKFAAELCAAMTTDASENPKSSYPSVVVNTFPYKLSNEENEAIRTALRTYFAEDIQIRIDCNDWDVYSPRYCRDHVAALILYDYNEWMEKNTKNFEKCVCPQVVMYGPAIYFDQKHSDEDIAKISEISMSPFESMQFMANPIIGLNLMDVRAFSVYK